MVQDAPSGIADHRDRTRRLAYPQVGLGGIHLSVFGTSLLSEDFKLRKLWVP
jgi:hypothetical protein